MPTATLVYFLADPQDKRDFNLASQANRFYLALEEIKSEFRRIEKYSEDPDEHFTAEKFFEILEDNHINLDEIDQ